LSSAEQGPLDAVPTGSWGSITIEAPDFLEPVRQAVDAFFSFLIEILNILIAILDVLKVFATGLLDPVIAIIERLQRLIENLLLDLRQAGLYIHGDFYILQGPDFQSLRGGYLAYERRMYARLVDHNDPDRPDISEDSTVLAVLLFVQVDIFGVNRIVQLIKSILALFNRQYPVPRMQPRPYNIRATYGYEGSTVFAFNKGYFKGFLPRRTVDDNINSPYNAVNLTWQMSPIPGAPFPDTPVIPPAGFIVEFSTMYMGLSLKCERPIQGALEAMRLPNQPAKREVLDVIDEEGNPIKLTGGADQISVEGVNYNDAVALNPDNPVKPDAVRIYATRSLATSSPIDISLLKEGDNYYLQRTFFVPFSQNLFFPGKGYGATFNFDQMPFEADFEINANTKIVERKSDQNRPDRYWVRIRAVNRSIKSATDFQYLADQVSLRNDKGPVLTLRNPTEVELNDLGPASDTQEVLFPDASTEVYLRAVAEALAVVALSRPDLPLLLGRDGEELDFGTLAPASKGTIPIFWGEFDGRARKATGLEDLAPSLMPQIVGRRQIQSFYAQDNANVQKFRKKLFNSCIALTNRLYTKNNPPLAARRIALERAQDLLGFSIFFNPGSGSVFATTDPNVAELRRGLGHSGGSLLELLQQDNTSLGIGPNPLSVGLPEGRSSARHTIAISRETTLARRPHFFFSTDDPNPNASGRGSVDSCPVAYFRTNSQVRDIEFVRNLIPDSVYEQALTVLQIATGPITKSTEGGWIAIRLFPMGLPEIDRFFDKILALLRSIQAAVDSIAETIVRYIEFLQSRLRELQAFLNRINTLIQRLLRFFLSITPAAGLVLVGQGTQGIISGLTASQNKPLPPIGTERDSYAGGVILVAGGIPNVVLDIFRAFFAQE
jgi:hypothetical protein